MKEADEAEAAAWTDRMQALWHGCEAAILALQRDAMLSAERTLEEAIDILWTMMPVRTSEELTIECGWSLQKNIAANIYSDDQGNRTVHPYQH